MSPLLMILIILLIILLLGGGVGYRSGWIGGPHYGYGGGIVGIVLIVLLVLLFTGRL